VRIFNITTKRVKFSIFKKFFSNPLFEKDLLFVPLFSKEGDVPPLLKAPTVGWQREVRRDFL